MELNALFTKMRVRAILDSENYHFVDTVLPFVAPFVDLTSRLVWATPVAVVLTEYQELL